MAANENVNNMIAKISQEHKAITDYVVKFPEKLKTKDKQFFDELNSFINLLQKDLLPHFEMEEKVFFPAAIMGAAAYETTLMVMKLQKDHGALEKQLQLLVEASKKSEINPETFTNVQVESAKEFFNHLKVHIKRELIEIFPMIDENPRSRSLVKSYAEKFDKTSSGDIAPAF